jgi:hypothetical protein
MAVGVPSSPLLGGKPVAPDVALLRAATIGAMAEVARHIGNAAALLYSVVIIDGLFLWLVRPRLAQLG